MKVIVIGNGKGGTGKSTISMNLLVALQSMNKKVYAIDADAPQHTLTQYIQNRNFNKNLSKIEYKSMQYDENIDQILHIFDKEYDFVIIDLSCHYDKKTQHIHSKADLLITPITDSLIDTNVLQSTNSLEQFVPGAYAELVWQVKKNKINDKSGSLKWLLLPNRINIRVTNNQKKVIQKLKELSKYMGCIILPGIKDRVLFRELFESGKTIFDLKNNSISTLAAKQEIRNIISYCI